jgi:NodT family efflux transporter outer membrane factor (OMF) lipoprotein
MRIAVADLLSIIRLTTSTKLVTGFVAMVLLGSLSACTLVGDYQRDEVEQLLVQSYVQTQHDATQPQTELNQWWHQFNDAQLNQLVDQALLHNYDLKVAVANVLESQALLDSAFAGFWPSINLSYSPTRNFISSSTRFAGNGSGGFITNTASADFSTRHQMQLGVSWQLDLFGRLRHAHKAASADLAALELDRVALTHSLIANVLRQRVEQVIATQRFQVAKQIVASRQITLDSVDRRYRRGVAGSSAVDVRLARENLLSAQATQTALQLNVELARHALDVLLGKTPSAIIDQEATLSALPELNSQIIGIPVSLLDRRPDLKAAEFRSIASNQRIGVALADLYPDLTLNGRLGTNTNSLSQFFSLDNLIASVTGELVTTLFQGGRLRAQVAAAQARLQAQGARYAQTVLNAVREVEDALLRNRLLDQRLQQVTEQREQARFAESLARERYTRGIDSLLIVLETERRRQSAEDLQLQVQQLRWNARIDLHLAIGGDWQAFVPVTTQNNL